MIQTTIRLPAELKGQIQQEADRRGDRMIRFLISIPEGLHRRLRDYARSKGQTLNGLVRQILWDWAERQGRL